MILGKRIRGGDGPVIRSSTQDIVIGEQLLSAQLTGLSGSAALSRDQATRMAENFAPAWKTASAVSAQYVALTLHDQRGKVAYNVASRPVWLVMFTGVAYDLASGPQSGCTCTQNFIRPNSAVALDAHDGSLVVSYGLDQ